MRPPPVTIEAPTAFRSARNAGIDMIIVHAIAQEIWWPESLSGEPDRYIPAVEWLSVPIAGRQNGVSAHCTIDPGGEIHKLAEDSEKTWHAGVSEFGGETNLNRIALGVELEVQGKHNYASFLNAIKTDCYTPEQYTSLGWLVYDWMERWQNIIADRVVGHKDVSGDDVRGPGKGKKDPGALDVQRMWFEFDRWIEAYEP